MNAKIDAPSALPLPGFRPLPLLGGRGNQVSLLGDPVRFLTRLHGRHGPVAAVTRGDPAMVCALGPEYNQQVLLDNDAFLSLELPFGFPLDSACSRLNAGLLFMNGARHRRHRRLLAPTFHRQRIEGYVDDIVAIAEEQVRGWPSGVTPDIMRPLQAIVDRVINRVLFGLGPEADLGGAVKRYIERQFSPGVLLFPRDLPGLPYRRLLAEGAALEAKVLGTLEAKRRQPDAADILSLLLAARTEDGDALDDSEVVGHATLLFFAAYDTTIDALAWTLFLLAQHPEVHAALVEELSSALDGGPPTLALLGRVPLLDRVIKESLRLLPPLPLIIRTSTRDIGLGRFELPAGARVCVSPYMTQRMPELYAEPRRFRPERWETLTPVPGGFLPFGAGNHGCIGAALAMLELRVLLAVLVSRLHLTLPPEVRVDRRVRILMSPRGLPMRVTRGPRNYPRSAVRGDVHEMVELPRA